MASGHGWFHQRPMSRRVYYVAGWPRGEMCLPFCVTFENTNPHLSNTVERSPVEEVKRGILEIFSNVVWSRKRGKKSTFFFWLDS